MCINQLYLIPGRRSITERTQINFTVDNNSVFIAKAYKTDNIFLDV